MDKLVLRLRELQGTDEVVNVIHMFCALTLDIISEYSFARAYGAMDSSDFASKWYNLIIGGEMYTLRGFPLVDFN